MIFYLYIPGRKSLFFNFKSATCKIFKRINKRLLGKGASFQDGQEMGNT